MGDAYTQLSSVSWDTAAYNALAYFPLRDQLIWDQFADVRPTAQTHTGVSVTFTFAGDLAAATTPLTETTDVDAVALSDSTVTVTLVEYGNAVLTTAKIRLTSYIEVDPVVANVVGYNAGISIDEVARDNIEDGTNVRYATGGGTDPTSTETVDASDTLTGDDVRFVVAKLRTANAMMFGNAYVGVIHPEVSYDFRGSTNVNGTNWRDPHIYSSPENIFKGEIGMFEGVRFIENPRAVLFPNASDGVGGAGTIDVYGTIIMGQQAFAKAFAMREGYGPNPQVVLGPITDKLRRFVPVGWKHFVGYDIFRQAALWRIESASSIGANT